MGSGDNGKTQEERETRWERLIYIRVHSPPSAAEGGEEEEEEEAPRAKTLRNRSASARVSERARKVDVNEGDVYRVWEERGPSDRGFSTLRRFARGIITRRWMRTLLEPRVRVYSKEEVESVRN